MRRLTVGVLVAAACASPGMPPGGPPDVAAPEVIAIAPDSGRTGVTPREVIFRFNEVVSERPPSVTTLADLFLISPRDGTPRVSWNRDEIAVRPRRDWRPNTAYTITMMGGLSDIRGNVRNAGASTFFSTGPALPRTRITGEIFDWVSGNPAAGALIESFVPPDSTRAYIAVADSNGRFVLEHLPAGRYLVRGVADRNRNRGIDPGEAWDSTSVSLADSSRVELLVFAHDTIGPRIREVEPADSVSIRVSFDKALDPTQQLTAANFSVVGRDSVPVPIQSVSIPEADTARPGRSAAPVVAPAVSRGAAPRTDTAAAPRTDTAAAPRTVMSRPRPATAIVLRFASPLAAGATYRVRASGVRGLLGRVSDSDRAYAAPAPPRAQTDTIPAAAPPRTLPPPPKP
ncbi:MAG TPA: Ig-like domain-containing protein [Gemmatimonadaceae bacterium]|nr:Ig-like domain-containing protein [Gemmatimonadaceae bacterium]